MQMIPQITLRDFPHSDAIELCIRKKLEKLEQFSSHIIGCHISVDQILRCKNKGKLYNIAIDLKMKGQELVINKIRNEDVYVAIRDAFNAARRQIQRYNAKMRGQIKTHDIAQFGTITRLYPKAEWGLIESQGQDYYFSPASLTDLRFHSLMEGMRVFFLEALGDEGFQAHRITRSKNHLAHIPE